MPRRILIIGILFCLCGILAIWDIIDGFLHSHIRLNLAIFMLPVGIGLLRGKKSSQNWARVWIVLGYAICGIITIVGICFPKFVNFKFFDITINGNAAVPYLLLCMLLFLTLLITLHKLLYSMKACDYFAPPAFGSSK